MILFTLVGALVCAAILALGVFWLLERVQQFRQQSNDGDNS